MNEVKAVVKQIDGITFAGKAGSNHWVIMDGPENFNGADAGTRPKELILLGLAGCTGSDVISILMKKRSPVTDFKIEMTARMSEEHPKIYTDINVHYVFYGNGIKPNDVERAIELSMTKYCAVTAMLQKTVNITHDFEIVEETAS